MPPKYVAHPLYDTLLSMAQSCPPSFVLGIKDTESLTDDQQTELQSWAIEHVRPTWLTGIGLIEAAEKQVWEAIINGNIYDPRSCAVCQHFVSSRGSGVMTNAGKCRCRPDVIALELGTCEMFELAERWIEDAM